MLANFGPMDFFFFLFLHQHSDLCFYLQSSWMNLFWHSSLLKHVNVAINKQHLIHGLLRIFVMIIIKIKYIPRFPLTHQHYHTTTALSTSSIILCLQTETSKKPVSKAIMIIMSMTLADIQAHYTTWSACCDRLLQYYICIPFNYKNQKLLFIHP